MGKEIERKFLVIGDGYKPNSKLSYFKQGYLSTNPQRTVRVRLNGNKGYITVKGISNGAVRPEYEYEIPAEDAEEMLEGLCEKPLIEKYRYECYFKGYNWEIDEFFGKNEGLVIAEIELSDEDECFEKPEWVGEEVTSDSRYFNSSLVNNPYCNWK
ncbi:MAG: CYTH domain-containing protein [Clostridia bacterium]|nr:CYTH domain-containing protein [Clostridia bacterium]